MVTGRASSTWPAWVSRRGVRSRRATRNVATEYVGTASAGTGGSVSMYPRGMSRLARKSNRRARGTDLRRYEAESRLHSPLNAVVRLFVSRVFDDEHGVDVRRNLIVGILGQLLPFV